MVMLPAGNQSPLLPVVCEKQLTGACYGGKKAFTFLLAALLCLLLAGPAAAEKRIIINKATNQLQFWQDGILIRTFPVATGRRPSFTPEGNFRIVSKIVNPYYSRLGIPGGSPRNPLGCRWLGLSIGGGGVYGIHGTNNPASIGTYASAGCIRMYNNDVKWLFAHTPLGTPVIIINNRHARPAWPVIAPVTVAAGDQRFTVKGIIGAEKELPMLPLRAVCTALDCRVTWDGSTRTARVIHNGAILLTVDCNAWQAASLAAGRKAFPCSDVKLLQGTMYVPLSFWPRAFPFLQVNRAPGKQNAVLFKCKYAAGRPPAPGAGPPGTPCPLCGGSARDSGKPGGPGNTEP